VNGGAGCGGVGFIVDERFVRGGLGDTVDTVGRQRGKVVLCRLPFRVVFPIAYIMIGLLFKNTTSRSQDRASGAAATRQQVWAISWAIRHGERRSFAVSHGHPSPPELAFYGHGRDLPRWSCEFEQGDDKINQAGHLPFMIIGATYLRALSGRISKLITPAPCPIRAQ
jgi:hypothetical protein